MRLKRQNGRPCRQQALNEAFLCPNVPDKKSTCMTILSLTILAICNNPDDSSDEESNLNQHGLNRPFICYEQI